MRAHQRVLGRLGGLLNRIVTRAGVGVNIWSVCQFSPKTVVSSSFFTTLMTPG
jgi:hypothetical protein